LISEPGFGNEGFAATSILPGGFDSRLSLADAAGLAGGAACTARFANGNKANALESAMRFIAVRFFRFRNTVCLLEQ
jgi:hypothetical protein